MRMKTATRLLAIDGHIKNLCYCGHVRTAHHCVPQGWDTCDLCDCDCYTSARRWIGKRAISKAIAGLGPDVLAGRPQGYYLSLYHRRAPQRELQIMWDALEPSERARLTTYYLTRPGRKTRHVAA